MSKRWKGSMTVEAVYVAPIIGMVFFFSVLAVFYYHDKNILNGCAYEAVVVGSAKAREKEKVTAEAIEQIFYDRAKNKCILFRASDARAEVKETEVCIEVRAKHRGMKIAIAQSAKVTEPEKYIRSIRSLESGLKSVQGE